jgi:hypothetical protein
MRLIVTNLALSLYFLFLQCYCTSADDFVSADIENWYTDKGKVSCLDLPLPPGTYGTGYRYRGKAMTWTKEDFENMLDLCSAHSRNRGHFQGFVWSFTSLFSSPRGFSTVVRLLTREVRAGYQQPFQPPARLAYRYRRSMGSYGSKSLEFLWAALQVPCSRRCPTYVLSRSSNPENWNESGRGITRYRPTIFESHSPDGRSDLCYIIKMQRQLSMPPTVLDNSTYLEMYLSSPTRW